MFPFFICVHVLFIVVQWVFWRVCKFFEIQRATVTTSLSCELHGRRVGVDLSIWLYHFGLLCAHDILVEHDHSKLIAAILHAANVCRKQGATLVFVADCRTASFPPKSRTDAARKKRQTDAWTAYLDTKSPNKLRAAIRVSPALQADVV